MELFNFDQTGRKPGCKTLVCTASRQTEDLSMAMPTKRRVLVVDDDPGVRDSMAMSLQSAGYKVAAAEDGLSALSLLRASAPDAIVSDLNMPRMSGFELLSLVRCFFPGIVTVAMSGAYRNSDELPTQVVADGYYPKGERLEHLFETLAQLLGSKSGLGPV